TLNDVKHIIIVVQENHSFDNYFGVLPNAVLNGHDGPYHGPSSTAGCDITDHQCVDGLRCSRGSDGSYTCKNHNPDCTTVDAATGKCTAYEKVRAFHSNNYCPAPDLDHGWSSSHHEVRLFAPNRTLEKAPMNGFVVVNDATEQPD